MVGVGVRLALWIKLLRSFFGVSVAVFWPGKYERVVIVFFFCYIRKYAFGSTPSYLPGKKAWRGHFDGFYDYNKREHA